MKAMRSMFSKQWHPQSGKSEYEIKFAVDTWKSLTPQENEHHSLEQCKQCFTPRFIFKYSYHIFVTYCAKGVGVT